MRDHVTGQRVFGFRRRCAWCGRELRLWQRHRCRMCFNAAGGAGLYLQGGGPPCSPGEHWDSPADEWKWPWQ